MPCVYHGTRQGAGSGQRIRQGISTEGGQALSRRIGTSWRCLWPTIDGSTTRPGPAIGCRDR